MNLSKRNRPTPGRWRQALFAAIAILLTATSISNGRAQPVHAQDGGVYLPTVQRAGADISIASPNGRIVTRVRLTDPAAGKGTLRYGITYDDVPVIQDARLGLAADGITRDSELKWLSVTRRTVNQKYSLMVAERDPIPNRYNEYTIHLQRTSGSPATMLDVVVRAYDEGVALRYSLPAQDGLSRVTISADYTQYAFTEDHTVYQQASAEDPYARSHLSDLYAQVANPLTIEHTAGFSLSIAEANVDNFPRMTLKRLPSPQLGVSVSLDGSAVGTLPIATPWRLLMIADTLGQLVEQNYIMYNLADAQREATGWLHPGNAIRVNNPETEYAKRMARFASDHGIKYIEFDAGWHSPGYDDEANGGGNPLQPMPGLDINAVIKYAHELQPQSVGVVLYVNYKPLSDNPDYILETYGSWGVDGIKIGFAKVDTQDQLRTLHLLVQDAARLKMFVDIHDDYRPSGLTRTLPNLLTQEYVRGGEHSPDSAHDATLPFTRYLIGAADYTIPYYNSLVGSKTRAHQLALGVIFFSPLRFVFWQDDPSDYDGGADADFLGALPTTWDDTVVLHDAIGESVTIARRSGNSWYVGSITNETARTVDVPLTFLDAGKTYEATIYSDVSAVKVGIEKRTVTSADVITGTLLASGGQAIWLKGQ